MRKLFFLLLIGTGAAAPAFSQQNNAPAPKEGCTDAQVHSTLVSLNSADEQKGFTLKMFETFGMPSGNLIPFTVTMEEGQLYDINFVANQAFNQYTFAIIDKDNNKLTNKKVKSSKVKESFMNQNFVAPYSGSYIIVVSQKVKGQAEVCGGISVLKAAGK